jgi:hypothetical protein
MSQEKAVKTLTVLLLGLAQAMALAAPSGQKDAASQDSLRHLPPNMRFYYAPRVEPGPELRKADSFGLRLVGKWGAGPSVKVTGRDSLVFLSRGSEVVAINFADTANPEVLSYIQVNGLVSRSVLVGNRLYVGTTGSLPKYVEVFDVSDPRNAVKLGEVQTRLNDIAVQDTLVYTITRDSFKVFDFANPASPTLIGACRDSGYTLSVCNGYAYLGDRWGLYVIDARDPANPHRIASWGTDIISVAARNTVCCVTMSDINDNLTFHVLDTRQPASITPLGSLADHGGYDIYLDDSLAFVSGYYTGSGYEFQIMSIADSQQPRLIGQASTLGDNNGVWANTSKRLAFVADRTEGLQAFDISSLSSPRRDTTLLGAGPSLDIAVHGNLAAVATQSTGLKLVSVANPTSPMELGSIDSTYDYPDCDAVELADSFAFMGWQPYPYLRTILVSDPANPVKVGACQGMQNDAQDMKLRDSLLYTASMGRFYVVNVARPREPVLVGTCTGDGVAIVVQDSFAYTAAGATRITNVARPDSPFVVSTITGHSAGGVAVRDTFLYMPAGYDTLWVYSVANPASPYVVGLAPARTHTWDVALAESSAAVATFEGLELFDLGDPARPRRVGLVSTPYGPRRVVYSAPYWYAAMFEAGVGVYETVATGLTERGEKSQARPALRVQVAPSVVGSGAWLFTGSVGAERVRVLNAAGRVETGVGVVWPKGFSGNLRLNTALLVPGVYFVEVTAAGRRESVKFVKE